MYSCETLTATELSHMFVGLHWCSCRAVTLVSALFFLWQFSLTVFGALSLWVCSEFALLLFQRSVQTRDEFEESPAEALLFGFPLQRVEPSLLLPRVGRRRSPHVAACAGASGQVRLGRREELAGRSEALLLLLWLLLVFLFVHNGVVRVHAAVRLVQAGLVERVVLGGRAEEAGAAAGAAGASEGSASGRAGSAEAAVDAC